MIVAITKRIRSREGSLRLTLAPATIAKIFNGKITNWNDEAIKKLNPRDDRRQRGTVRGDPDDTTGQVAERGDRALCGGAGGRLDLGPPLAEV
ncbi:hypothetical protein [Streptomyces spiralis]|uniref:hypothetical protein n=1 Tax=Streptomyces spiralis TaxID=66376 RepID=UPI0033F6A80F